MSVKCLAQTLDVSYYHCYCYYYLSGNLELRLPRLYFSEGQKSLLGRNSPQENGNQDPGEAQERQAPERESEPRMVEDGGAPDCTQAGVKPDQSFHSSLWDTQAVVLLAQALLALGVQGAPARSQSQRGAGQAPGAPWSPLRGSLHPAAEGRAEMSPTGHNHNLLCHWVLQEWDT
jgi:hypothetical protein